MFCITSKINQHAVLFVGRHVVADHFFGFWRGALYGFSNLLQKSLYVFWKSGDVLIYGFEFSAFHVLDIWHYKTNIKTGRPDIQNATETGANATLSKLLLWFNWYPKFFLRGWIFVFVFIIHPLKVRTIIQRIA